MNTVFRAALAAVFTLALGKNALYRQMNMSLSDAYEFAGEVVFRNMLHDDAQEGIRAFLEKREPTWRGRKAKGNAQ